MSNRHDKDLYMPQGTLPLREVSLVSALLAERYFRFAAACAPAILPKHTDWEYAPDCQVTSPAA